MALYAIADTHLSLGVDKPMDVFGGWSNYVQRLEENWRTHISAEDTVVIAGDVSWAMHLEDTLADFRFLNALPGRKLIMKGNHDYWWSTKKKMDDFFAQHQLDTLHILFNNAYRCGGLCVCGTKGWPCDTTPQEDEARILARELGRLGQSLRAAEALGGEPVVFLHYPPYGANMASTAFYDALQQAGVRRCYYGHLHAQAVRRAFNGRAGGVAFRLISADGVQFHPVLVEE